MTEYKMTKSAELFARAQSSLPGGVNSVARLAPHDVLPHPPYFTRGKGSHLWYVYVHEYVDFALGYGPLILGHELSGSVAKVGDVAAEKGDFPHYMLKEIHEQPRAVAQTLEERVAGGKLLEAAFGPAAQTVFAQTEAVRIVACGTSFHAAVVAKYFIEQICRLPCWVEIASEYRYRNPVVPKNTLFVSVSQSGETADTLAALRMAKQAGYLSQLAICNVPESSLVRESDLVMLTRAGPEIGVASTKAFTTQLTALGMLVVALAKFHGADAERERGLVQKLLGIPALIEATLKLDPVIKEMAKRFVDKQHALFLGRGPVKLPDAAQVRGKFVDVQNR